MLGLLIVAGCHSPARMDRAVQRAAVAAAESEPGISAETVADSAVVAEPAAPIRDERVALNQQSVLTFATANSRELQNQRDDLYRAALTLFGTRRDFGFEWSGTLEYVMGARGEDDTAGAGLATLTLGRILPTGGRVEVAGTQRFNDRSTADGGDTYAGRTGVLIEQPLLAGAGYQASHEDLVQAERDYQYALRDFTLRRQDFAIDVLRAYYDLISQRRTLENTATNYQQFVFLRQRSEAMFKVNRAPAIDVLRSQQEELSALNRLTSAEESFRIQTGRFLVKLGLPSAQPVTLTDDIPDMRPVAVEEEQALALALARRLDVRSVRDQLTDARRRWAIARNRYLPDVNAFGSADWVAGEVASWSDQDFEREWQAGARAVLPLDRRDERDAIQRAYLGVRQAERRLAETEDTVALDVRESFSRLRSLAVSVDIQLKNMEIAERRAANALLQFRNGTLSNRDVVEAANGLLDARNAYVNALADHEIQRLILLRQVGLLDVARDGALVELPVEPAGGAEQHE